MSSWVRSADPPPLPCTAAPRCRCGSAGTGERIRPRRGGARRWCPRRGTRLRYRSSDGFQGVPVNREVPSVEHGSDAQHALHEEVRRRGPACSRGSESTGGRRGPSRSSATCRPSTRVTVDAVEGRLHPVRECRNRVTEMYRRRNRAVDSRPLHVPVTSRTRGARRPAGGADARLRNIGRERTSG